MTILGFSMSKMVGVIYPIPLQFVSRILAEQRNVFVRYLPHATSVRLTRRNKVLFYASHGQKEIVGEATIKAIEFLTPLEALEKHGDKVFLNRNELMEYASRQPSRTNSKKMLVLVLSKPKKYAKGIIYGKPMTMAGEYLTEENYDALFQKVGKRGIQ
jgi:hypothetical protein